MFSEIISKNEHIQIKTIIDPSFKKYGTVIYDYDFSQALSLVNEIPIPEEGNVYVAKLPALMNLPLSNELSTHFYGGMPIQIGYCNGNNSFLNALEYHKGAEIDVAVTDFVLLLSSVTEIEHNQLSSDKVEAFYVPKNTAVGLYGTTLHFSPCKVSSLGFKSIIVLPQGTNIPFDQTPTLTSEEDQLLWMQNKWLIAHKDSVPASHGAYVGIIGDNIQINY